MVGLHRTAGYILGVDPTEEPPRLALPDESRPIAEPYVCIAVQSSTQCKYWNNPAGWREVVRFLKAGGYRVICIDQKPVHGIGLVWNHIPQRRRGPDRRPPAGGAGALAEARRLPSSACRAGCRGWPGRSARPVVLISGFTHPTNEFADPVSGDQLARLQQLLERPASCASTTRTSCGARGMPTRRGSSSAPG